jgi:hypothetical protein
MSRWTDLARTTMLLSRPVRRVLLLAGLHLVLAVVLFVAAVRVTAIEIELPKLYWWSEALFWLSIALLEPARSIVDYLSPPRPLAVVIFLMNSLAWGYAMSAAIAAWRRRRAGATVELPRFSTFWLSIVAPLWAVSGAYLLFTRATRVVRGVASPGEIGVAMLGAVLVASVGGLAFGKRWARIALITHWTFVAFAGVVLLSLRGLLPEAVAAIGAGAAFVALLTSSGQTVAVSSVEAAHHI